jgi:ceramide glucosyltransferase
MLDSSQNPLVVMADSDVRVGPDFCRKLAWEFADPHLSLVTCPYRAVGGDTIWSRLEAVGMNTEFIAGLLTAVMLEGAKFAVGPTIVARRSLLEALGGMERFKDYLAEDFVLGRVASERGYGVDLSSYVIEHRIGSESMARNFKHRIRWARSTRCSRPAGYIGQFFTYPLPIALIACAIYPALWPMLALTIVLRAAVADMVSRRVLRAKVPWLLLVVQDLLAFVFWIAGFFGNSVDWRGRRYLLKRDGTMQLAG